MIMSCKIRNAAYFSIMDYVQIQRKHVKLYRNMPKNSQYADRIIGWLYVYIYIYIYIYIYRKI